METHTLAFEHLNAEVTISEDGNVQVAFRKVGEEDNPVLLSYAEFTAFAEFAERHAAEPVTA